MYNKLVGLQKMQVRKSSKRNNSFISIACVDKSTISLFACPGK
ncbi:class III lanthipeptide [Lactobacillus helveticus]|nr:class III lanthipeptide [Lactobacillus helveticus]MBN6049617.1 class III lanthipeptide [Lactobacillus helveticus]